MAGLLSAIRLREEGIDDFTVYEKADNVGGTWRENTYPGLSCDVPSHLYSYSFAPNPQWTHRYSPGPEIQAYFERVADEYDLMDRIEFGQEIRSLRWIDDQWHLETAAGIHDVVDVVIAATGVLHHPNIPEFEGIETFEGATFHSARWDHDVPLDGKRVGVVGTGSTAVQITAALADRCEHFSLFQRTAQWVLAAENPTYTDEEQSRFEERPELLRRMRAEMSRRFTDMFSSAVVDAESPFMAEIQRLCEENLDTVEDPELRERLRPDYRAACKRLVVSDGFYDAITHPNAELVTSAIERVEPTGVRTADGVLHELDVLVLATGFRADRFLRPIDVTGIDGVSLDDLWRDRPSAYQSISVPGLPNLFMLNGPNAPVGNFSLIEIAELQFAYILQLIEPIRRGEKRAVHPTVEALDRFNEERTEQAGRTVWATGCRSWYLDDRGVPSAWPWPFDRFREVMAEPVWDDYATV